MTVEPTTTAAGARSVKDLTVTDPTDLIRRAGSGDREAFTELCREHGDRLLTHAMVLCRDRSTAEDLVQETLVAAWRNLGRFNGGCRLFTWLCTILIRRHRDDLRRRWPLPFSLWLSREDADTGVVDPAAGAVEPSSHPDAALVAREQAAALLRSVRQLPRRQRDVVYLRYYAGESLDGIAAALNCSLGTVKSRLFHGLERLRRVRALAEERTS